MLPVFHRSIRTWVGTTGILLVTDSLESHGMFKGVFKMGSLTHQPLQQNTAIYIQACKDPLQTTGLEWKPDNLLLFRHSQIVKIMQVIKF